MTSENELLTSEAGISERGVAISAVTAWKTVPDFAFFVLCTLEFVTLCKPTSTKAVLCAAWVSPCSSRLSKSATNEEKCWKLEFMTNFTDALP